MPTRLSPKQKVKGYTIEKVLNEGAFANAYKAVDSAGRSVFFKQYKSPSVRVPWYPAYVEYQQKMKRRVEERGLANLTYKFLDFFESKDSGQRCFYQVFEFVTGGRDLREHLNDPAITWHQRVIFAKLLMALMKSFHNADIIHTDLKPENLYLIPNPDIGAGYNFKVIDFDQAIFSDEMAPWDKRHKASGGQPRPYAGTKKYMSPEHLSGKTPVEVSDVFTCGLILYELLSKLGNPYGDAADDEEKYYEMVSKHAAPKPKLIQSFGSAEADAAVCDILWRCLDPNPDKRPTADDVHKVLLSTKSTTIIPKPIPVPKPIPELKPELNVQSLILRSDEGKEERVNVDTLVGQRFMDRFGEDSRFYSSTQYTLVREAGEWYVVPNMDAKNDTIWNDRLLTEKTKLSPGDRLAVGKIAKGIKKLELTLDFKA